MFYVTMTDTFLSGWGKAEGRIAKFVFVCDNWQEAEIVKENAERRGDQKYINISTTKPYYSSKTHLVQYKTKENAPNWYKVRYF